MKLPNKNLNVIAGAAIVGPLALTLARCFIPDIGLNAGEIIGNSILWITAVVVAYYTYETHKLRTGAERREIAELRGYEGIDGTMTIKDDEVNIVLKNFGKTPLYKIRRTHKFIERDTGREHPMGHSFTAGSTENPGETNHYRITLGPTDAARVVGIQNCDLVIESAFAIYTGKRFKHALHLRIHNEGQPGIKTCYVVSDDELAI